MRSLAIVPSARWWVKESLMRVFQIDKMYEMKNGIYPLQKGCAKDIISPMERNSPIRKGWWLREGPKVAPICYELSIT